MRKAALALLAALTAYPQDAGVRAAYDKLCSGCHGADARGTQQGPGLAGNPWTRRRNAQTLRNIIVNGVPAQGMPAFDLPAGTLDGLVKMILSLNAAAAEANLPGDPAQGRAFFFGAGKCSACHMVQGEGTASAPDLSSIGRELTSDQLREALLNPSARLAPGYATVTAKLRTGPAISGQTIRGYARSRTAFHIAIQEPNGRIHPLAMNEIASLVEDKSSAMPAVKAAPAELQNLLAYLSRLTGIEPNRPIPQRPPSPHAIPFSRIANPQPGDWLTYNGNLDANRRSPLTQITPENVHKLTLKWSFTIPLWQQFLPDTPYFRENMRYFGLETVPLAADGVMYVTGPNQVYALDARSGAPIWHYSRPRTPGLVSDPSLGTNRGVAILNDHVFFVTDNAHLLALHRVTGKPVWEAVMPHEPQKYGGTIAPLIVKDLVVAGVAGGDWGIRGFLDAYHADTGRRAWRHWTIPAEGDPGWDTWKGTAVQYGGGSTWLTGSYDPSTDTLYWATGNPWPNSDDSQRGGDNLFTDSVLALDPDNGKLKWHYQFTPHDTRDWDATEPNVLADTTWRGQPRKLLLHADRNGFFYVFDRTTGERLLSVPFLHKLTWASGIDAGGRPIRVPETNMSCPDHATNWNGTVFSPATRLYYIIAIERCVARLTPGAWRNPRPPDDPGTKYLRALDIETGKIAWEVPLSGPVDGKRVAGLTGTATGLLFYGDPSGYFLAADERNGKTLWQIPLNATLKTSPMTYAVNGQQYIAFAAGANILVFGLAP
jgi:PQQ-dependent dehydrogenase (methanol/ethanol family)